MEKKGAEVEHKIIAIMLEDPSLYPERISKHLAVESGGDSDLEASPKTVARILKEKKLFGPMAVAKCLFKMATDRKSLNEDQADFLAKYFPDYANEFADAKSPGQILLTWYLPLKGVHRRHEWAVTVIKDKYSGMVWAQLAERDKKPARRYIADTIKAIRRDQDRKVKILVERTSGGPVRTLFGGSAFRLLIKHELSCLRVYHHDAIGVELELLEQINQMWLSRRKNGTKQSLNDSLEQLVNKFNRKKTATGELSRFELWKSPSEAGEPTIQKDRGVGRVVRVWPEEHDN